MNLRMVLLFIVVIVYGGLSSLYWAQEHGLIGSIAGAFVAWVMWFTGALSAAEKERNK